jgi:hypothetical protein
MRPKRPVGRESIPILGSASDNEGDADHDIPQDAEAHHRRQRAP